MQHSSDNSSQRVRAIGFNDAAWAARWENSRMAGDFPPAAAANIGAKTDVPPNVSEERQELPSASGH
jgi:hypothetical protein